MRIGFLIIVTFHLFVLTHLRFTAWPEMFSYPYLLNNGFKPYLDIALPYEPLLPLILAAIYKIFGTNLLVLQTFTWVLILASDFLIFLISVKIIGKKLLSLLPLTVYVFIQPVADGNMLWFDLATVPFILLAFVSFIYFQNVKKFLLVGIFLGMAFFIKQQIGVAIALLGFYLIIMRYLKGLVYYAFGFLIPTLFISVYILSNDLVADYFFWTVITPLKWYPSFPGYVHMPTFREAILIGLMFGSVVTASLYRIKQKNTQFIVAIILFLGTFLTAFPRFELFRMQPAIALGAVLIAILLPERKKIQILFLIPILLGYLMLLKSNLININGSPRFYSPEDFRLANFIGSKAEGQVVYLLGINSLQYVLTDTVPPKPWIDNYVWYMEIPNVQEKALEGLKQASPKIIFRTPPLLGNWFDLGVYQPQKIVDYIYMHYNKSTDMLDQGVEVWTRKD